MQTGEELPKYKGLCLSDCSGCMAVMYTEPIPDGRRWEFVHWGAELSQPHILQFIKQKHNEEADLMNPGETQ